MKFGINFTSCSENTNCARYNELNLFQFFTPASTTTFSTDLIQTKHTFLVTPGSTLQESLKIVMKSYLFDLMGLLSLYACYKRMRFKSRSPVTT